MKPVVSSISAADATELLRVAKVIAVVRARDGADAIAIVGALAAGGLKAIELIFTTPDV